MMWYDLATAIVLVLATWRGARKGFIWQLTTIVALVLAFCFAGPLSGRLAPLTGLTSPLDRWVSLAILYVVFSFLCFLAARAAKSGIEKIKLEEYDRHLGATFGFVKGAVLCLVVTFFAVTLFPKSHSHILGSYSGYASAVVFDELRPVVPDEYHGYLDASLKKLGQCGLDPDSPIPKPVCPADPDDFASGGGKDAGASSAEDEPSASEAFDALLAGLSPEHATRARKAFDEVSDETRRREMVRELENATEPETLAGVLGRWAAEVGQGILSWAEPLTDEQKTERRNLLFGIARTYTRFPSAQQSIVDEVAEQMRGVPPRIQLAVLQDWDADLRNGDDPDIGTTPTSPLDHRIHRQLMLAQVPDDRIDSALLERLESWR